ncbi:putative cation-transporting P-type ATPase J [Actinocatenispora thailandica]|uniref:Putative cation-transporting P-type ATPase J n=1 Tax=Actinocatenispora thailandica TaxID=227318 RepID=A0A7R7DU63_9ACTN|nr:heavy metal translocating P-type ATPase [Actinocatenispora thailandica]BCJ37919.1 putative cation-transporting P-type ATPase J [Actinocatenispora thailandica]
MDTLTAAPAPTRTAVVGRRRTRLLALPEMRWAAAALALFLAGLAVHLTGGPAWAYWPLYLACYLAGGWEPALAGLRALKDRTLDVDLLMVAAAIGAAAIGQVLDGALLIVIFATSGALEALATARTEDSVRGLLDLTPDTATRLDSDGAETTVPVADLAVGEVILVRPGDRIGADGTVLDGASEVDQATITGEPLPADKSAGDEVFAGTVNGTGALRVRVQRPAGESVVARIAALVEEASRTKATTQLFIEKVEQRYSVGMVAATVLLFTVPLLFGAALQDSLLRAMTFMIVASPCAVVLATMPPLLAAIANAGRHGVLVKSAVVMERLGTASLVAFDKTGTLTRGVPHLVDLRALPGHTDDEVLRWAASAEHRSEHPLAAAIVRAARERDLPLIAADDFDARPGQGITARLAGHLVQVGAPDRLLPPAGDEPDTTGAAARPDGVADIPAGLAAGGGAAAATGSHTAGTDLAAARAAARTAGTDLSAAGRTAVVVLVDHRPIGVLGITDQVRADAPRAVGAVAGLTGREPVLLTGDNEPAARQLADQVGIREVRAGLLPDDKVAAVREYERAGHRIAVVGDGINDAPALAAAHTGLAMGGAGSDLTLQTADAVIIRDELAAVPAAIALSRRARRVVVANLVIAATVIAGLVTWDLAGELPLPLGVAGHEGSTVLVGLNGLRLLRGAAWPGDARRRRRRPRRG